MLQLKRSASFTDHKNSYLSGLGAIRITVRGPNLNFFLCRVLEAFYMKCQRQLLQIKWYQFIRNDEITESKGLPSTSKSISHHCNSLFGDVARLFQLTKHSTVMLTYRSDVHQVANRVVAQAVSATDGLTRFVGTTTSCLLTSGGVLPSIVVTAGQRYGLCRISADDNDVDDDNGVFTTVIG